MNCKKCGKRIAEDAEICPRCGAPQGETVRLGAIRAAHAAQKKRTGWASLNKTQKTLCIVGIVLGALLALFLVGYSLILGFLSSNLQQGSDLSGDLGINNALPTEGVQNIALFGLDNRTESTDGRSDAIIILSIDRVHNQIKMSSIARDTLVPVEGYPSYDGKTKLTHAFAQGGVSLAVKTLNQNFGMNIQDYMYVNFREFMEIIDYIGGVEIEVEQRELNELNNHIYYMEIECNRNIARVKSAGLQTLSGGQALAYARIRKIDSDIARGDRQKEVLQAVFDKVKGLSLTKYPGLIAEGLGICHTNLSSSEILSIATWAVTSSPEFVNFSLPSEECKAWGGNDGSHGWVWIYDLEYATSLLHNFIYEEGLNPEVSRTTTYISRKTTTTTGQQLVSKPTSSSIVTTTTVGSTAEPSGSTTDATDSPTTTGDGSTTDTGDSTTDTDLPADGTTDTTDTTSSTSDPTASTDTTENEPTEDTSATDSEPTSTAEESTTSTEDGSSPTEEVSTDTTQEVAA